MQTPNKNSLSFMRSNLIGHMVILTSEKYRMTNQKPDTIFSPVGKFVSFFFPPFGAVMRSN